MNATYSVDGITLSVSTTALSPVVVRRHGGHGVTSERVASQLARMHRELTAPESESAPPLVVVEPDLEPARRVRDESESESAPSLVAVSYTAPVPESKVGRRAPKRSRKKV